MNKPSLLIDKRSDRTFLRLEFQKPFRLPNPARLIDGLVDKPKSNNGAAVRHRLGQGDLEVVNLNVRDLAYGIVERGAASQDENNLPAVNIYNLSYEDVDLLDKKFGALLVSGGGTNEKPYQHTIGNKFLQRLYAMGGMSPNPSKNNVDGLIDDAKKGDYNKDQSPWTVINSATCFGFADSIIDSNCELYAQFISGGETRNAIKAKGGALYLVGCDIRFDPTTGPPLIIADEFVKVYTYKTLWNGKPSLDRDLIQAGYSRSKKDYYRNNIDAANKLRATQFIELQRDPTPDLIKANPMFAKIITPAPPAIEIRAAEPMGDWATIYHGEKYGDLIWDLPSDRAHKIQARVYDGAGMPSPWSDILAVDDKGASTTIPWTPEQSIAARMSEMEKAIIGLRETITALNHQNASLAQALDVYDKRFLAIGEAAEITGAED